MKLVILAHYVRGLNDPHKIARERYYLNSMSPKVDVMLIQEHKMRGMALHTLGNKSNDCDHAISKVERQIWNELLSTCQIHDSFVYEEAPGFCGITVNVEMQEDSLD